MPFWPPRKSRHASGENARVDGSWPDRHPSPAATIRQEPLMSCCAPSCCTPASERSARSVAAHASNLPVAIIGAGPVGLAAAAYLLARGIDPVVLEAGPAAGMAPRTWGHVRMFSPW